MYIKFVFIKITIESLLSVFTDSIQCFPNWSVWPLNSAGGDPSHDVRCPDVWSSSDWRKRGRHLPAQDQVGGGGPPGAAPRHVNPRELQAQPNKPPDTTSGCLHLMIMNVTAVDVFLYGKLERLFGQQVCNDISFLVEECRRLGFQWCWSLDQKGYFIIHVRRM